MGAAGKHVQHIFRAHDGEQKGLGIAIDGGEKDVPTWLDQRRAGFDDGRRIGHMLQHFHAGDDIKAAGLLGRQRLGADFAILHSFRLASSAWS